MLLLGEILQFSPSVPPSFPEGQLKASEAKVKELTEVSAKTATQNAGEVKMKEARQGRDGSLLGGSSQLVSG